uniref:Copine C-terminal domain-containing protein n=1 Tax=Spongospora subterranea TaxID=70186 RepID=A0A0H5QLZ5_9EUKA|eukprot:CRZ02371.1 hypothetical protein [Spongospora subterranea]
MPLNFTSQRDIVQFVPMNLYRDSDMNRLSAEVLSEIPAQLLSFMKLRNVRPMMKRKISPVRTLVIALLILNFHGKKHVVEEGRAIIIDEGRVQSRRGIQN